MKLTVLTENIAGGEFRGEHGLSYLLEVDNFTVLFDAGHSDVFLQNAAKLKLNLHRDVDLIVLSHGHWDHGNGLKYIQDKPLLTHPASFMRRFRKTDSTDLGLNQSRAELEVRFKLKTSSKALQLTPKLFFLGEIPRINQFEAQRTAFVDENGNDDFVPDDSALAIIENNELIVVTGCSHSGICNICEHAKNISGITRIKAVIGGFHLKKNNQQTVETIRYFKQQQIDRILPSHCTDLPALAAFHSNFESQFVKTGQLYHF